MSRSRLASLLTIAIAAAHGASAQPADRDLGIGDVVAPFDATALDGRTVSLRAALAEHKAVVVVFLSTVCPYARYFASHLRELDERYGPRGVLFIGVNPNGWESRDEVAESARRNGFAFAMVKDEDHALAALLGARVTPEAFLLDGGGRLRYRGWVKSRQESPDLQRAIDDVLDGKSVRRAETKAFGCAVDRPR